MNKIYILQYYCIVKHNVERAVTLYKIEMLFWESHKYSAPFCDSYSFIYGEKFADNWHILKSTASCVYHTVFLWVTKINWVLWMKMWNEMPKLCRRRSVVFFCCFFLIHRGLTCHNSLPLEWNSAKLRIAQMIQAEGQKCLFTKVQ